MHISFKKFFFLLSCLFVGSFFRPIEIAANPVSNHNDGDPKSSILWKIEKQGSKDVSYLMGTIHLIAQADYFFTPNMQKALTDCKKAVFEIDMNQLEDPMALLPIIGQLMMKGDTTLQDLLSAAEYAEIVAYFQKNGMPMEMAGSMKPMVLSMMASTPDIMNASEDDYKSYEKEIANIARDSDMGIGGLETIEEQLSIFDQIPYKVQAKMLYDEIHNVKEAKSDNGLDQMVEMYKNQDLDGLQKMITEGTEGLGAFGKLLVDNRNNSWIPKMEAEMKTGSVFFAVGAGHLPGEGGVINLLKKAGYKVTPVNIR